MIDFGCIAIYFKDEHVKHGAQTSALLPSVKTRLGVTFSGQVDFNSEGQAEVSRLNHKFDSIPSSFSSLAFIIIDGTDFNRYPYVRLCASPAKILQGHNVYGSDNPELCLFALVEAFVMALPHLAEYLDFATATLEYIDITYSAKVANETVALQVLSVLKNVSGGQTKNRTTDDYIKTVYWGKGTGKTGRSSRRKQLKAYSKERELQHSIKEIQKKIFQAKGDKVLTNCLMRQLASLAQPEVQQMAQGAIRFESRLFATWLKDNGFSNHLYEFIKQASGPNVLNQLWQKSWQDIFKSFEGAKLHIHDDNSIHESLKTHFYRECKDGRKSYTKANRLFDFYNSLKTRGFDTVYRNTDRATFSRYLADLKTAGLSRAQLQNLTAEISNVIPLVRLINVDFNTQHPEGWQEPETLQLQTQRLLKLVS